MPPRQDPSAYQKQNFRAQTDSDSTIHSEKQTNKQYYEGSSQIKKAHQLAGRTFVIISQEIVDELRINQNTWFRVDIAGNGITLTITHWKENIGLMK
jgi:hypothetical protein